MKRNDVCYLIGKTTERNAIGVSVPQEHRRKVFCSVMNVNQSEWMEAGRLGFKPMFRVDIFAPDYHGEEILEHNGERYGIYRTYREGQNINLYVEKKAGV